MGKNITLAIVAVLCFFPTTVQANSTEDNINPPSEEQEGDSRSGTLRDRNEESEDAKQRNTIIFTPPSVGVPSATTGGGSRDSSICGQSNLEDAPVTPIKPKASLGLSAVERPVFFAFIPNISASKGLFFLADEEGNAQHETWIELPDRAGIIRFDLPNEVPPLEVGKDYEWSFVLVCGENLRPDDPFVRGTVRRVDLDLALDVSELSLEKAAALAEAGIWYDTVSVLAELRRRSPDDANLKAQWQALLESQGLESVAEAAILTEFPGKTEAGNSSENEAGNSTPTRQRGTFARPRVGGPPGARQTGGSR